MSCLLLFLGEVLDDRFGEKHSRDTDKSDDQYSKVKRLLSFEKRKTINRAATKEYVHQKTNNTWGPSGGGAPVSSPFDEDHDHHIEEQETHEKNLRDKLKDNVKLLSEIHSIHAFEDNTEHHVGHSEDN
mmetsp:Transcript_16298/g.16926  ORF Transcript_16298/g.16926 Transcript_16298/m.16926 type:complete len:129 (-) Transcript_16298:1231-1617(-)